MNVQFQPNSSLKILKKSQMFNKEILHLKSRAIFFESHGCDPREDLLHPPVRNPDQFNYKDSFFLQFLKSLFEKGPIQPSLNLLKFTFYNVFDEPDHFSQSAAFSAK